MRIMRPSAPSGISITGPVQESLATWSSVGTYALGDQVFRTDPSTTFINIYESLQGSNTNKDPLTETDYWVYVSASNLFRMFDNLANSQTTAANSIVVSFFATPFANMVALLNVSGATANVTVTASGVEVYNETKTLLVAGDGVDDWYEYFFGDMARHTDVLFTDLPSYASQVITVTLAESGATVSMGTLAVGYGYDIGDTQYGLSLGIIDYSRKVANDFGYYDIVERAYARRMNATVTIENSRVDEICNLLPQFRATPIVVIGADDFSSTYIYGFIKEWELAIRYVSHSVYTMTVEGLT
jgi:hypothetical protein